MAIVSRSIPTLLRGISQSSDSSKQSDHADIQDNADSNPVVGLVKRSGIQHITNLSTGTLGNVHIQTINIVSIIIISLCSIIATILVSIYPASKASSLDTVKTLKYE